MVSLSSCPGFSSESTPGRFHSQNNGTLVIVGDGGRKLLIFCLYQEKSLFPAGWQRLLPRAVCCTERHHRAAAAAHYQYRRGRLTGVLQESVRSASLKRKTDAHTPPQLLQGRALFSPCCPPCAFPRQTRPSAAPGQLAGQEHTLSFWTSRRLDLPLKEPRWPPEPVLAL